MESICVLLCLRSSKAWWGESRRCNGSDCSAKAAKSDLQECNITTSASQKHHSILQEGHTKSELPRVLTAELLVANDSSDRSAFIASVRLKTGTNQDSIIIKNYFRKHQHPSFSNAIESAWPHSLKVSRMCWCWHMPVPSNLLKVRVTCICGRNEKAVTVIHEFVQKWRTQKTVGFNINTGIYWLLLDG